MHVDYDVLCVLQLDTLFRQDSDSDDFTCSFQPVLFEVGAHLKYPSQNILLVSTGKRHHHQ